MDDRELLELAAKAAGITDIGIDGRIHVGSGPYPTKWREWNPLTDDGDALRLAVKLGLYNLDDCLVANAHDPVIDVQEDPYAATRRAIVRAAAEIWKGM